MKHPCHVVDVDGLDQVGIETSGAGRFAVVGLSVASHGDQEHRWETRLECGERARIRP